MLAEGIETVGEARRLAELKVPLVQGFYFARPAPPFTTLDPTAGRELASAAETAASGLHRLVDAIPPIVDTAHIASVAGAGAAPWTPVIDRDRRPMGLLTVEAALTGELVDGLVANVNSSPSEVAQRLSTAVTEPTAPILVVDNAGRYLGVIPLRRILADLGGRD